MTCGSRTIHGALAVAWPRRTATLALASALTLAIGSAAAFADEPAAAPAPIRLAVFDFELEDFSAGGPIAGESPAETARLARITDEARKLLARSGRYELVDIAGSAAPNVREHWLRKCNGCDADIARELGARQSLLGVMQKLSVLVHTLRFEIRDAATGKLIWNIQTDLRGDTDESWLRSVKYLIEQQLLAPRPGASSGSQPRS